MIQLPMHRRQALSLLMAAPFVLVACSNATTDDGASATTPAAAAPASGAPADEAGAASDSAENADSAAAPWLDIELTDAATGETFTLASLKGQVVALEPMAVWCTNCKHQQDNVKKAYPAVQEAGVRYISLGIDPNEDPETLARYADRQGYEWTFAQASSELARALSDTFGPQIVSAPSTPLIVLDPDGQVSAQTFGPHRPAQLLDILGEAPAEA